MPICDETYEKLTRLIHSYEENRDECRRPSYNETSLRVEYLNPLFKLLGWDVDNETGQSLYTREVIHEANVTIDTDDPAHSNKKPDYAFRTGGAVRFFLEAKKPSVNILNNSAPSFQARRYGWSGNHRIVVLSNFEDTCIYDCAYVPNPDQPPSFARIAHYHYDQLLDSFGQLSSLISKDAVLNGSLETINADEAVEKEPFDDYFLAQIRNWRFSIAKDICEHYEVIDDAALNRFTQAILDRIIFLRVCEDRGFEKPSLLFDISSFSELKNQFAIADAKYDSGLFHQQLGTEWSISDEVLKGIFEDLYFPNSSYSFSVVQPHVIGQIYEQFLSENLSVENGWVIFEQPDVVADSDGVVPTPKEITDVIVAQTLEGIRNDCRVADICCGSGNFLLSAFEYLMSSKLNECVHTGSKCLIERASGFDLPYSMKREILERDIYGVDINPLAVEVTKLSLLLRLLENCEPDELEAYTKATGNKLLPDLSNNIKCGNSIVDESYYSYDPSATTDVTTLRAIRPFDWSSEFTPCSFDAIVGNPPYIRVQNMKKHRKKEYDYIKSEYCGFATTQTALVDKYQVFIERALSLLSASGKLGMIVPNKFLTIKSGSALRKLLSTDYSIAKLIDFSAVQVFPGRSTYTCIFVATPEKLRSFKRQQVESLSSFIESPLAGGVTYPSEKIGNDPWCFPPDIVAKHLVQIEDKCVPLASLAEIFVGLQTSNDEAYTFEPIDDGEDYYTFNSIAGGIARIEKRLCRPCLLDVQLEPYASPRANKQMIFPYEIIEGKPTIIPISRLREEAPMGYEYFMSIRQILSQRSMGSKTTEENWHRFGRSQSLSRFCGSPHIVWTVMSLEPKYELDRSGDTLFTGGGNGPYYGLEMKDTATESIEYLLASLCYNFTETLIRSCTSVFGNNYYSHGKQFVADVPIRRINFDDPSERAKHDEIKNLVTKVNRLISLRDSSTNDDDETLLTRSIDAAKRQITCTMDDLYEVNEAVREALKG